MGGGWVENFQNKGHIQKYKRYQNCKKKDQKMPVDFKAEIIKTDISFMTSKWIIEKVPFIFADNLEN